MAACHAATLPKAFFETIKDMVHICGCSRYFSHSILRLKICSVVLLSALNPAFSSAIISLAWGFKPAQDEFQYSTDEANINRVGLSPIEIVLEVRCKIQTLVHKGAYTKVTYFI